jgi:hypothetical protein
VTDLTQMMIITMVNILSSYYLLSMKTKYYK